MDGELLGPGHFPEESGIELENGHGHCQPGYDDGCNPSAQLALLPGTFLGETGYGF